MNLAQTKDRRGCAGEEAHWRGGGAKGPGTGVCGDLQMESWAGLRMGGAGMG